MTDFEQTKSQAIGDLSQTTNRPDTVQGRGELEQLIATITPPAEFTPGNRDYKTDIKTQDVHSLRVGSMTGFVRSLNQEEVFRPTPQTPDNPSQPRIPAGTPTMFLTDIAPFGISEHLHNPELQNAAKLYMTRDLVNLVTELRKVDTSDRVIYTVTDAAMAKFMIKHWGFSSLGETGKEQAVQASLSQIEATYPHLVGYIPELQQRMASNSAAPEPRP